MAKSIEILCILDRSGSMATIMDEAIAASRRALELEPNNAKYWRQLSAALGFSGRAEEALSAALRYAARALQQEFTWDVSVSA